MEACMHCKNAVLYSTISKAINNSNRQHFWKFYQGQLLQLQCLGPSKHTIEVIQLHINTSKAPITTENYQIISY